MISLALNLIELVAVASLVLGIKAMGLDIKDILKAGYEKLKSYFKKS